MDYISLTFEGLNEQATEALSAILMSEGFEGIEIFYNGFGAYIPAPEYQAHNFDMMIADWENNWHCQITKTYIEPVNWNTEWEKNFEPVMITDDVYVRATFHEPKPNIKFDILIEPKMSFGTGHHATTSMMMQYIMELDVKGKRIFDIGTGTGILAILSSKAGASEIVCTDIDSWCIENTKENVVLNGCVNIEVYLADSYNPSPASFDIVLANIQRNYFESGFAVISGILKPGGRVVTSGYLIEDQNILAAWASIAGLTLESHKGHANWFSQCFIKEVK